VATVHLVKDGRRSNGDRITKSVDLSTSVVAERLGHFENRRTEKPPTINPDVAASDWAEYKHVVVEICAGDEAPQFSAPGYYYIIGLAPAECARILGVSFPAV